MPLEAAHILYRILFSMLILLTLLWLALAEWPPADRGEPAAMLR